MPTKLSWYKQRILGRLFVVPGTRTGLFWHHVTSRRRQTRPDVFLWWSGASFSLVFSAKYAVVRVKLRPSWSSAVNRSPNHHLKRQGRVISGDGQPITPTAAIGVNPWIFYVKGTLYARGTAPVDQTPKGDGLAHLARVLAIPASSSGPRHVPSVDARLQAY